MSSKYKNFAAGICLLTLSGAVYASEAPPSFELPTVASSYTGNSKSYLLASNEAGIATKQTAAPLDKPSEFQPRFFTMSKAHQYLGLGTLALMGLTVVTNPGEGCEQNCGVQPPRKTSGTAHTRFARAAATFAAATVTSGLIAHWDDFHVEDGFSDPDNLHALLGATGAALMLYAVNKSAKSSTQTSHAGMAELGGVAMAVAIKLTW